MNIVEAASKTMAHPEVAQFEPYRTLEGTADEHAVWMLNGIVEGYIGGKKSHRWLAYAQGVLVGEGHITLHEAKEINKGT